MKSILVLAHDDPGQEARLQAGLDVCRALEGHLHCLDVTLPLAPGGHFAIAAEAAMMEEERQREIDNEQGLRARLAGEDVPWSLAAASGDLGACLAEAAGLADLVVLNPELEGEGAPEMIGAVSAVLTEARRQVLAVPQDCRGLRLAGPAVVAWDGSRPAKAALCASVPLLGLAGSVTIVEVQGSSKGSVEQAAAYLSRHGIHADVELIARLRDDRAELGSVIADLCTGRSAALLVMGAYGHSRLREALFGGVTRYMLGRAPVPLLLAH